MTSWYEMEDEENRDKEKQEKSLENINKTLTVLEALPTCMDWRQIFNLPGEICQHLVVALQHPKLYADKVKDVGQSMKDVAQYVACNTTITFTDDDLLLGSKPDNRSLFII